MTELALETELTPEQRDFLQMAKGSADSLLTIINDILDFSKIEAGKLDLEPVEFELRGVLGTTMKTMALRAQQKGLEVLCEVSPEVPEVVIGDAVRLRQIVVNLIGNATKFTERGEVAAIVKVQAQDASDVRLHFVISDTGVGIPKDKQKAIFEAFRQADGSTTRRFGGTGLGLSISSQLVKLMGGEIWVESEPGEGSRFHFTASFKRGRAAVSRAVTGTSGILKDLAVLVVDDNATNRKILEGTLKGWGARPVLAEGAAAAIEAIEARRDGNQFRLILLDSQMPSMDGFELAELFKKDMKLSASIIMLTSSYHSGDTARSLQLGVACCLNKPVTQSELRGAILKTLWAREPAEGPEGEQPASHSLPRPAAAPTALKILLAEDNLINQKVAVRMLEKRGHSVAVAGTGLAALKALDDRQFDVVLMDVQMPEMGGFEATAAIREREKQTGGHIPIVALTAHALNDDRERCLAAGMDAYVSKPITAEKLLEAIDALTSTTSGVYSKGTPRQT